MIKNQLLIFRTVAQYERASVNPDSIAFVVEDGTIRTHNFTFGGKSKNEGDKKHVFLTQEEYDALEEYDENSIYFILEPGEDDPIYTMWVFDGLFPVILS